jgi:hypothetical protein
MAQVFLVECQVSGALHVEFARRRFRRFEEAMLSNQLMFPLFEMHCSRPKQCGVKGSP